jgi:hypothetical protein
MNDGPGSALTWAGLIAAVTALAGAFLPYLKQKDENKTRIQDDREKMRSNLDARVLAELDRLEAKNIRLEKRELDLEAEILKVEKDRDRGWDLARAWHNKSAALWHRLANKITIINGLFDLQTAPAALVEKEPPLPPLEGIET